jgi:predicted TIM-barrel fold metal-dependent hydrolase
MNRRTFLGRLGAGAIGAFALRGRSTEETVHAAIDARQATRPIVDAHVHVWTKDARYPWAPETKNPPDRDATAETLLELMAANGVDHTVIIQVIHYRWDNRYVADVLKKYPGKFRGVARVNPEDPDAPDHLVRLTREQGFHGVRLSPAADASGDWIRGPLMRPLWRRCRDLRVPMTLLTPVSRLADITALVDQFPDLTVVIDHMADVSPDHPEQLEPLLALERYPNVFVKISHAWSLSRQAYPYADVHAQIHRLYDRFGPQRLIAGTDWPISTRYCTYPQAIRFAQDALPFLNTDDKRWICGLAALKVWPFPAA